MDVKEKVNKFFQKFAQRKPKEYLKILWVPVAIIVFVVAADLITKSLIENNLELGETVVIIPNFIEFYYTRNSGAAFSFLSGMTVFLIVFTVIAVSGITTYLVYDADRLRPLSKVALAFIIGGALGNLYDRIFLGEVRDFVHWIYFGLNLPLLGESFSGIFNVADLFLTCGAILLIISIFIGMYPPADKTEEATQEQTDAQEGDQTDNQTSPTQYETNTEPNQSDNGAS